jgi:CubicO group peptidase (beta-lactamase class C family)
MIFRCFIFIQVIFPAALFADSLEHRLNQIVVDGGGHGLAAAVVLNDQLAFQALLGMADYSTNRAVSEHTLFQVASVSKLLTGMALLTLANRGLIDLEMPVREVVPELQFPTFNESPAPTIRHLLEHTTGIQEVIPRWLDETQTGYLDVLTILKNTLPTVNSSWPAGEHTIYSNYNYMVANHVIEKITGKAFDRLIEELIFRPLGMNHSTFRIHDFDQSNLARGYIGHPPVAVPYVSGAYRIAAGMSSSMGDLTKLLLFCINSGRFDGRQVIPAQIFDDLETPITSNMAKAGIPLGHGAGAVARQVGGLKLVGHNGIVDGFAASFFYDRERQFGYAITLNSHPLPRSPSLMRIRNELLAAFAPNKPDLRGDPSSMAPDRTDLRAFTGFYARTASRFRQLELWDYFRESVWVEHDGQRPRLRKWYELDGKELIPYSRDTFRIEDGRYPAVAFSLDHRNVPMFNIPPNENYVRSSPFMFYLLLSVSVTVLAACMVGLPYHLFNTFKYFAGYQRSFDWGLLGFYGSVALMIGAASPIQTSMELLSINAMTFTLFAASMGLPLFSGASLLLNLRSLRINRARSIFPFCLSLSCLVISITLWWYGLVGISFFAAHAG